MEENNIVKCAFCGKEVNDDECTVIESLEGGIFICEDCVSESYKIIKDHCEIEEIEGIQEEEKSLKNYKPSSIHKFLDEYVIGQEKAKKILSVGVYNHYKSLEYKNSNNPKIELQKSNILLLGPTGVGKTYIVKTLAKMLDVPLAIQDATNLTEAGYVGEDVENCIRKLIEAADGDIERAEKGIIYIDEIDKLSRKGENPSITRDVSGEGVQQTLLKIIEGDVIEVSPKGGRKHPMQECYKIDTSNILFICGGSFEGLDKIIQKRLNSSKDSIGFGADVQAKEDKKIGELFKNVTVEDIKKFGMLPEFLGRLPIICPLEELNEKALIKILTKPKDAIVKQYKELFGMDNIELEFEEQALKAIAKKAIERKTGARSLRSILEENLIEYMYSIPDDISIVKVIITKDCILRGREPIIERKSLEEKIG